VLYLSYGEQGKNIREEIRPSIALAENRHDLFGPTRSIAAAVCSV
jgi:hypothetical protein